MKHSGIVLGLVLSVIAAQGLGAHLPKPTKPRLSVSANLNPQLPAKPKTTEDKAEPDELSVLEKGSRVVASNTPDEDFVILGSLEPTLPEPKHVDTDAEKATAENDVVTNALGDIHPMTAMPDAPPAMLKAPVEVKAGIQPKVSQEAVTVAGPNIGATPAVKPAKIKPITSAVTPASPLEEALALQPPPEVNPYLQRPDKVVVVVDDQKPAPVLNKPVKLAVKAPVKTPVKAAVKMAVKAPVKSVVKAPVKLVAHVPVKTKVNKAPVKVAIKTPAKVIVTTKVKHLMAKATVPSVKRARFKPAVMAFVSPAKTVHVKTVHAKTSPVKALPAKTKIVFASYHPPKHSKPIARQVLAMKPVKASFKPVIKSFKPRKTTLHVERKPSHFHPVIKPYIAS